MDEQTRRQYLQAMGVEVWLSRSSASHLEDDDSFSEGEGEGATACGDDSTWHHLESEVKHCQACGLAEQRTNVVFGSGLRNADWLIVGESPGQEEDKLGEPFVDASGELLSAMLFALGLKREQVFITNIVKCRPLQKRDLGKNELECCAGYLRRQVALVNPKVIFLLGRVAVQGVLSSSENIAEMRGRRHFFPGTDIPVVISYHPAYLLRKPMDKRKMWQDLQYAYQLYAQLKD